MKKRAKVKMTCWALVELDEDAAGNQDIMDILDVYDIDEFEVVEDN